MACKSLSLTVLLNGSVSFPSPTQMFPWALVGVSPTSLTLVAPQARKIEMQVCVLRNTLSTIRMLLLNSVLFLSSSSLATCQRDLGYRVRHW